MESVTYDDIRVSRRNRYDGDGSFGEVTVGKPRSIEELRQCFFECQIATGAAGPVHADEFAAIDNLNVPFPCEDLQRGGKLLRSDIRGLSRGWDSPCARGDSDDGKTDGGGDHAYAHNAPSPWHRLKKLWSSSNAMSASMQMKSELAGRMNTRGEDSGTDFRLIVAAVNGHAGFVLNPLNLCRAFKAGQRADSAHFLRGFFFDFSGLSRSALGRAGTGAEDKHAGER